MKLELSHWPCLLSKLGRSRSHNTAQKESWHIFSPWWYSVPRKKNTIRTSFSAGKLCTQANNKFILVSTLHLIAWKCMILSCTNVLEPITASTGYTNDTHPHQGMVECLQCRGEEREGEPRVPPVRGGTGVDKVQSQLLLGLLGWGPCCHIH